MSTITESIPSFSTTPQLTQPATFSADTDKYHIDLIPFVNSLNIFSSQTNNVRNEVNNLKESALQYKNDANESATLSNQSKIESISAKDIAVQKANDIESYSVPEEATYNIDAIDVMNSKMIQSALPFSGYTDKRNVEDNFTFYDTSSNTYQITDKNRFIKFGSEIVDTGGNQVADFSNSVDGTNCVPTVTVQNQEADGLEIVSAVNKGDVVVVDKCELVTNGGFDNDTDGWTLDPSGTVCGTYDDTNKALILNRSDADWESMVKQNLPKPLVSGLKYVIKITVNTAGYYLNLRAGDSQTIYFESSTTVGDKILTFTANGNHSTLDFYMDTNDDISVDNISVQLANDKFKAIENADDMYDYENDGTDTSVEMTPATVVYNNDGNDTNGLNGHYYRCKTTASGYNLRTANFTTIATWIDLGTASTMSLANPYFKQVDYISNQALAYHRYNPLTKVYDGIKTEVMMNDAWAKDSTTKIMTDNDFSSLGGGLFSKDGWLCVPVGYFQTLNSGSYNFFLNPYGTMAYRTAGEDTIASTIAEALSVVASTAQTFDDIIYYPDADAGRYDHTGNVAGTSSNNTKAYTRPDGKYFDIVYPSQFRDLRYSAKAISYHDIASKEFSDGVSGKGGVCDTVGMVETVRINKGSSNSIYMPLGEPLKPYLHLINTYIVYFENGTTPVVRKIINVYDYSGYVRIVLDADVDRDNGYTEVTKQLPITQSKEQFCSDIVANPLHYNTIMKDMLARGETIVGLNPLLIEN